MASPIKSSPSGMIPRPSTPPIPDTDENIPYPYSYTILMVDPSETAAVRAKFMAECNLNRWQHIHKAEIFTNKVKK